MENTKANEANENIKAWATEIAKLTAERDRWRDNSKAKAVIIDEIEQLVSDNSATATEKHNELTVAERRIAEMEEKLTLCATAEPLKKKICIAD